MVAQAGRDDDEESRNFCSGSLLVPKVPDLVADVVHLLSLLRGI